MRFYTYNLVNVTCYIFNISEDAVKAGLEQEQLEVFAPKRRLGLTLGFRSSYGLNEMLGVSFYSTVSA